MRHIAVYDVMLHGMLCTSACCAGTPGMLHLGTTAASLPHLAMKGTIGRRETDVVPLIVQT